MGPDGSATIEVIDPSTAKVIDFVSSVDPAEIDGRVETAKIAAREWQRLPLDERAHVLFRVADAIENQVEDLARLETSNVGKPIVEARAEVDAAARAFRYYAGAIDKFFGQIIPSGEDSLHYSLHQPIGVVGAILPWNFPLLLAAWKVAPALAAGNAILVKPAALTPLTTILLGEVCRDCGVPEGAIQILPGSGGELGRALVDHPEIRKLSFTGSTEVGGEIAERSARSFKRLTLELGGKSANIIFADADKDAAVEAAVGGCFANAGQDCCARSRILIERSIYDEVVSEIAARISAIAVGDPRDETTEMGPLVSEGQRAQVLGHIEESAAEGASMATGGSALPGPGFFVEPTLVVDVRPDMRVVREEIFGPVAAAMPFDGEAEAIALANSSRYGLSGSVWTADGARAVRVSNAMESGVVSVNTSRSVHLNAPFGGVKDSGVGREMGMAAMEAFTEQKSVYHAIGMVAS